jgi:hypothetical protein
MISTFKHDSQGFLIGELLDVNRELLDARGVGMAERKTKAWHKRLLKTITGRKEGPTEGMVGSESFKSGSFMGTLMDELAPRVMLFLLPILTAIGGVRLGGPGLLGGVKLGEFLYKWLADSALIAKILNVVDAAK